jgi:hypothetical protein
MASSVLNIGRILVVSPALGMPGSARVLPAGDERSMTAWRMIPQE